MIESKKTLVQRAANNAEVAKDFYLTLSEASEELFMKLWEVRSDRDLFVKNFALAGGVVGAAAGGVAGYAASGVLSAGLKLAAELSGKKLLETLVGFIVPGGSVIWPIVVGLIGAVFIAKMAKKIASANTMAQMEKKVAEAIAEFKEEVAKTKAEMTAQILDTVDKMFQRELETVDRSFSEFRMSVNIDGKNIPLLEQKMKLVNGYMQQIEEMKERRLVEL